MSERLTLSEFSLFRDHLRHSCGLNFTDDRFARVAKIVESRMSDLGVEGFVDYQRMLNWSRPIRGELATLADLLTVGETHFFRNRDHWRAFSEVVLPTITERNLTTRQYSIRIWSAGCSTGEEPYTAAIVLSRSLPNLARWSIEIIGTDLSPTAIANAKKAVYTENSFRGVPQDIKRDYFESMGSGLYRPRPAICDMVRFQEMNLLDTAAAAQLCDVDVIFCRNVLIYFDSSGIQAVLSHLHRSLRADGHLFLGHAESARGDSSGFASVNVCNTFIFTPVSGADLIDATPTHVRKPSVPAIPRDTWEALGSSTARRRKDDRTICTKGLVRTQPQAPVTTSSDDAGGKCPKTSTLHVSLAKPDAPTIDELRARAFEHLCAEEHTEAREVFANILRSEPDDSESLLGTALLLAGDGSSEAALRCCEHVLQLQPMSPEAYHVMALTHEGLGDDRMARREFEKAVYLDDGFSIAHFRLADLHHRAQRRHAAKRELNNALKALPGDDEQRVRLYSGGFSKEIVAQICEHRLGVESATVQDDDASTMTTGSWGTEGKCE